MTHWFVQWTEKQVKKFRENSDFMMDCIGSNSTTWKKNAKRNDIVWVHSNISGSHYLLGKMKLESLHTPEDTEEIIGRKLVTGKRYNEYWINMWEWEVMREIEMKDNFAFEINFLPINPLKEGYMSTQRLRTPQNISSVDHSKILDYWNSNIEN